MRAFSGPFVLLLALFLGGCLGPAPDPAGAERHRQEAELLALAKDFDAAADALGKAIEALPASASLYLRRAEFLEGSGRMPEARDVYGAGLRKTGRSDPLRAQIAWRLALLEALHLDTPRRAEAQLSRLPADGPLRDDLQGVLALTAGDLRQAVIHFNAALQRQPEQEVTAAVYYHASLAYHRLGDSRNTYGSLFHAVNNAGHRGVIRDIETLWELLNAQSKSEAAAPAR